MKLPVMMNASGITKIVIDRKIKWTKTNLPDKQWARNLDNDRGCQLRSEQSLLNYVRELISNDDYNNVWTSGNTLNVAKYTPEQTEEIHKKDFKQILRALDKIHKERIGSNILITFR
jgi:hypothetical protein